MDSYQDSRDNPNPPTSPPAERREPIPASDAFIASHEAVAEQAGSPEPIEQRPSRKAAWLAMGAVALALGLIWIAPGVGDRQTRTPQSSAVPNDNATAENSGDPDDADATGKVAPLQFTLKDMNGVEVKLASFKGKPIVINFWATWCGPCRAEIPSLVDLQRRYTDEGSEVVILGISVDDPIEKLKPYATEMKINYPLLVGNGRDDVQEAFGPLWGIPVTVFVDRNGRIAKRHSGIASKEQFEREIKALL
jgi:thiol-disulfide isomerase/thioredoxin